MALDDAKNQTNMFLVCNYVYYLLVITVGRHELIIKPIQILTLTR